MWVIRLLYLMYVCSFTCPQNPENMWGCECRALNCFIGCMYVRLLVHKNPAKVDKWRIKISNSWYDHKKYFLIWRNASKYFYSEFRPTIFLLRKKNHWHFRLWKKINIFNISNILRFSKKKLNIFEIFKIWTFLKFSHFQTKRKNRFLSISRVAHTIFNNAIVCISYNINSFMGRMITHSLLH